MKLTEGMTCLAGELHGGYIGEIIRFSWAYSGSRVHLQVLGELRQINHTMGYVSLCLAGHLGDGTDLDEFALEYGERVTFMVREP